MVTFFGVITDARDIRRGGRIEIRVGDLRIGGGGGTINPTL